MRRLLTLLFTAMTLAFVGCGENVDTPDTPTVNYELEITSDKNQTFDQNGGHGVITYTIAEANNDQTRTTELKVEAVCNDKWITDITVGEDITFNVEPMSGDERERHTVILVTYADQSESVNIHQKSNIPEYDVEFIAKRLNGAYYGKVGSSGYNYTLTFSDDDRGVPGRGQFYYDTHVYNIDIFSDVSCGFSCAPQIVPNGVYKFDGRNTGEPGTFMAKSDYTYYVDASSYGLTYYDIIDGTITVTDSNIDMVVRTDDGKWHHVTFSGDLTLTYDYIKDIKRPYTRLTEDFEFNYDFGHMHTYYRGDYFGLGYDVWYVDMCPTVTPMNGTYMMLMLMVDKSKGGYKENAFLGEYKVAVEGSDNYTNTYVAGDLRNGYEVVNTWCLTCENSMILNTWGGPIMDGTIKIDYVDGYYIVSFDCVDDNNNTIKGSFKCVHDGYLNQDPDNPNADLQPASAM